MAGWTMGRPPLGFDGAHDGFARLGEGGEEAIAFGPEHRPVVGADDLLGQLSIDAEKPRVLVLK